jgi:hypothetical protein
VFVQPIEMTTDPGTYGVTVPEVTYSDSHNSSDWPSVFGGMGQTTITFTFNAPSSPPTSGTPAIRY